ncbi:MAG: energy transducer TonB [Ignavibacteriae bacterium]|nr:energy transducer TonB [Ignavibacteriota bacterium]
MVTKKSTKARPGKELTDKRNKKRTFVRLHGSLAPFATGRLLVLMRLLLTRRVHLMNNNFGTNIRLVLSLSRWILVATIVFGCSASNQNSDSMRESEATLEETYVVDFDSAKPQPIPIKQVQPEHHEQARLLGQEGTVWVKALVGRDGLVKKVQITQTGGRFLDNACIAAAMQWQFTPAQKDGRTVAVWAPIRFQFKLNR